MSRAAYATPLPALPAGPSLDRGLGLRMLFMVRGMIFTYTGLRQELVLNVFKIMNSIVSSKTIALTFGVLVVCFTAGFYIIAWQEPSQTAPEGNVAAPLNTGSLPQSKSGSLSAPIFYDSQDSNYYLNPDGSSNLSGDLNVGNIVIKKDGSISTNLNADKVDDLNAADLLAAGGGSIYSIKCAWSCADGTYDVMRSTVNCISTCAPGSCYTGDTSLGTGCAGTGTGVSSVYTASNARVGWTAVTTGYCERICYHP